MDQYIYCFAIIEYVNYPKILAYYSPNNNPDTSEIKNIFSNPNFNIKSGILSSFSYDSKSFYLFPNTNSTIFFVVTNQNYPQRIIYDCMKELENHYNELYLNKNLSQILKKLYEKYSNPESIDKLLQVTNKINQVKDVMHDNINIALENTIKLETIELKSEELQQSAGIFRGSARELNKMWWKNFKMELIMFSIVAIILTIIISVAVTVSNQK
jgi:hypothetical protein